MAPKKARPNKGKNAGGQQRLSKQQQMENRLRQKKLEEKKKQVYVTPQGLLIFALLIGVLSIIGRLLPSGGDAAQEAVQTSEQTTGKSQTPSAPVLPADDTTAEMREFLAWLEQKGADVSQLAVRSCGPQSIVRSGEAECRTVFVKQSADAMDVLATLPVDLVFTAEKCELCTRLQEEDLLENLTPEYGALPQELQKSLLLALALAQEKAQGEASELFPWLRVLPKSFPQLPGHWSQDEVKLASSSRALLSAYYRSTSKFAEAAHDALVTAELLDDSLVSVDDLVWAMDVIYTRSVPLRGSRALLPFADLFNSLPVGNVALEQEEGQDTVSVKAQSAVGEASELLLRMGVGMSNAELLPQLGMVWRENPRKTAPLSVPVAQNEAMLKALQDQLNVDMFRQPSECVLEKPHVAQQPMVFNRDCLIRLRVVFADDAAVERLTEMLEKGSDAVSILTLPLSEASEERVWQHVTQEVRQMLSALPDAPTRDEKKRWSATKRRVWKVLREEAAVYEWARRTASKCPLQLFEDEEIGTLSDDSVASYFDCVQGRFGVYTGEQLIDARRGKTVSEEEESDNAVDEFADDEEEEIDL